MAYHGAGCGRPSEPSPSGFSPSMGIASIELLIEIVESIAWSGIEAVATFSYRRSHNLAIALLCALVLVCLGGLYFAGNLARFQNAISVKESQTALTGVSDPQQLDQVLRQYPANRILRMVALANQDSIELDATMRRLLNEAEPRDLSKPVDLTTFSRSDLETLDRDLKLAQSKAPTIKPRYIAAIKAVRDKLEHDARPLEVGDYTIARFMAMIDEYHTDVAALYSKALEARVDYYGAYEKCVALLLENIDVYKVVNGQFIFPAQSTADSYNAAAAAWSAAAKRMTELEGEGATLRQSQLNRWKAFVER